jgi:hypothetical protein
MNVELSTDTLPKPSCAYCDAVSVHASWLPDGWVGMTKVCLTDVVASVVPGTISSTNTGTLR